MNCNFFFLLIFKVNKRGRWTKEILEGKEVLAFAPFLHPPPEDLQRVALRASSCPQLPFLCVLAWFPWASD